MASLTLYPPVVNNTEPAFVTTKGGPYEDPHSSASIQDRNNRGFLRIYFYFSAFSEELGENPEENVTVHAKITNSKNVKVIDSEDGGEMYTIVDEGRTYHIYRLRGANIILNLKPQKDLNHTSPQLYYIDILGEDVSNNWNSDGQGHGGYYNCWVPGWIYKVQLRFSSSVCTIMPGLNAGRGQESWLFQHQNDFSEWSTVIYAKSIPEMNLTLTGFTNDYIPTGEPNTTWTVPTWHNNNSIFPSHITGQLSPGDIQDKNSKEYYQSYRIKMDYYDSNALSTISIDANGKPIISGLNFVTFDDSGDIYSTPDDLEKIDYTIKRRMRTVNTTYILYFSYITINGYSDKVYYIFNYQQDNISKSKLEVYTAETENIIVSENIVPQDGSAKNWQHLNELPENITAPEELDTVPDPTTKDLGYIFKYIGESLSKKYIQNNYYLCALVDERYNTTYIEEDKNRNLIPAHSHSHDLSIGADEEAGRISLKIRYNDDMETFPSYANDNPILYCIKRASAVDGFQEWTPIHYGYLPPVSDLNTIDEYTEIKYDYTAESGVWYKYGLEELNEDGNIVRMNYPSNPSEGIDNGYVIRIFEHSYLLGEGGKQLKIAFDPAISNYTPTVNDTKLEPIGSKFPYISRNGAIYYKVFPISGTISSQMDEEEMFFNKQEYYNRVDWNSNTDPKQEFRIADRYNAYAIKNRYINRDFTLERDFRNEVLKFLSDGKYKLFKSPSEGNIIVRLTDVQTTPNQTLSRLVYSFSANANETDNYTMDNCLKYGFYNPETTSQITVARRVIEEDEDINSEL